MQTTHIKKRLIFGFGFTLALLLVLLVVGLTTMAFMQQQLKDIVQNHNVKSELVSEMRQVEKERTIILYRLMTQVEPKDRDLDIKQFNDLYKQFSIARNSLLSMGVTDQEKAILDKQSEWSRQAVSLQDQVINYLVNGNLNLARDVLYAQGLQAEDKVLILLDELLSLQKNASKTAQSKASANYENARLLMIVIGIAVLLVGLAVAIVVIDRTMQAEASLFHQKEQAQVTLHSIGDGVITTNADGKIVYINPVAQQLTGWSLNDAKGQELMAVFSIVDEEGATPKLDPVLKAIQEKVIVNSNEAMLLFREGGRHYAVEYTTAPIYDAADTVTGAVLVFRNITAMRNLAHQLSHQAMHDSLTGLINRREFEKRLERALRLSRSSNQRHVLCYLDLDLFKVVNDTCGHIAGDELLKQVSRLLHQKVRKTDTLARLGGDEFGLLFFNCGLEKAIDVVNALRKAVKEYRFVWGDTAFEIGVSIGVVEITAQSGGITHIMSAADTACFVAKDLGRNRFHLYQPDDAELTLRRSEMLWLPRIQKALQNGDFELFFQKIQPLNPDKSISHHNEILIRMIDEQGHFLLPKAFIPVAERYDLMPEIDRWVIEATFKQLQYAPKNQRQIWTINLSGQTLTDAHFYQFIVEQTKQYRINPTSICFEITETAAVANLSSASDLLLQLKEAGFRFALDDFGSGLSSFSYLKNLPVEYLKIDGSFIRDMVQDPINTAMVESINQIGHIMGLKTIAEFVENDFINEKLKKLEVDFVQGFGIHKPELFNLYSGVAEKVN
ncbi:MAG: EAL domain-containing protein [Gammaproteobacteria bacterium]|nr:EAL domain-containing protein [Gammaproteobacteria bacterium]